MTPEEQADRNRELRALYDREAHSNAPYLLGIVAAAILLFAWGMVWGLYQ